MLGIPVKYHGMESAEAIHYAGLISELAIASKEFLEKKLFKPDDSTEVEETHTITDFQK